MTTPTQSTAYTLALVGVVFQAIGLLLIGVFGSFGMMGGFGMMGRYTPSINWSWMALFWLLPGAAIVGFCIYGLRLISSTNPASIHSGSVLLLIMAIVAFPTMWGLLIGSALIFAAAIINLAQHP